MGLFVKYGGARGYAQGFNVFLVLSLIAVLLVLLLKRRSPV
jgi:hypothetical protein